MTTPRQHIATWWHEAWTTGLWAAAWSKSLIDLTPEQAAWRPSAEWCKGERHSIWQLAHHMIFWRENWLRRIDGGPRSTPDERARLNFPPIDDPSPAAWSETRRRFEETQNRIAAALTGRGPEADPLTYFLPHDSYHFGQINMLRAMQGLKPIE